eukprot:XP_016885505.1 A-kinase anchor protein 17B-like [Homo sapiens]
MSKCQVAKSDNKQKQKMKKTTRDHLQKSSHCLGEENLRYSPRKQRAGILLDDEEYEYSLFFKHNSLEITIIEGQSLENEDHHGSSESCSRLSGRGQGRKPKIHETDAFFDYLFNYYEPPQYTRICLETSQVAGTCQWQRDVQAKGDGFQINLRKCRHHSINSSQVENLERKEQVQENNYSSKICTQDPERKRGKVDYAKECTNGFETHCQETAHKAGGQLSPTDGNSCLLEKTHSYHIEDSKSTRKSQVSPPHESIGLGLQLTDFLEEISSDSECFSETLSINKEEKEKSVATFNSFSEKEPLDTDKMITRKQNTRSSQQTFFSKWKRDGEEKYSNYKFRTPGRKSEYEPRWICSWPRGESHFIRHENNNGQMKGQLAPRYLFDEGYYQEPSSSYLKRFSDSTLDQKVNYGPSQVPVMSSRSARSFYFGNFHGRRGTPWKSEYNQNSRFRGCNYNYLKFNSDYYYNRHNGQEYIDYGSYSGNNCTGSLNFKCFDDHLDQEYPFSQ